MTGADTMAPTTVKRGWDRTNECCLTGCHNPRGVTRDGITSVRCQWHTEEWEFRLEALTRTHPLTPRAAADLGAPPPVRRTVPTFQAPGSLVDAQLCSRCHEVPRDFPDHLCEECRRG